MPLTTEMKSCLCQRFAVCDRMVQSFGLTSLAVFSELLGRDPVR